MVFLGFREWKYNRNLVRPLKGHKMTLERAGKMWAAIKKLFLKWKLSKIAQGKAFEACVESTMLFNVAARPFLAEEVKSFRRLCTKKYIYLYFE